MLYFETDNHKILIIPIIGIVSSDRVWIDPYDPLRLKYYQDGEIYADFVNLPTGMWEYLGLTNDPNIDDDIKSKINSNSLVGNWVILLNKEM